MPEGMDLRRVLLAFVLSLAVVLLYNLLVERRYKPPPAPAAPASTEEAPPAAPAPPAVPRPHGGKLSLEPGDAPVVTIETDLFRAGITTAGGRLVTFALKNFRRSVEPDSPPLDLIEPGDLLPLTVETGNDSSDVAVRYEPNAPSLALAGPEQRELVLLGSTAAGLHIEKRIRFVGDSYLFDVDVRVTGPEPPSTVGLVLPRIGHDGLQGGGSSGRELGVVLASGKVTEKLVPELLKDPTHPVEQPAATWVGFSVPYFVTAIVAPQDAGAASVEMSGSVPIARMVEPAPGGTASFKVFVGPKVKEVLADAGFDLGRTLDFGWFWFIAIPMLYGLRLFHRVVANYGVDIILLTALVRLATLPLMQKSFRSMKEMQKLQPQMKRLQEQYKDDQSRLQQEVMELYKRHQVNPLSGCAPMVLQIPIFVGLYNALLHAIELRHAPFGLWITDLSSPERLTIGGIGVPVLTLIMAGSMLVQQRLSPQQADPTQQRVMMVMPLVFTFMMLNLPSGLVLYWLVSNLLGIGQQYLMLRTPEATKGRG